jgi:hypothetical protein
MTEQLCTLILARSGDNCMPSDNVERRYFTGAKLLALVSACLA